MKKTLRSLILIALFSSALFYPSPAHSIKLGDMAPDFTVGTLTGETISYYADFRGKKPLYLIFWATW